MPDLTYREAVSTIVMETLDQADTLTVQEALSTAIPDEAMRYQASLVALPSRVLGVLVIAEQEGILSHDQMQELYTYIEDAGLEYLEKRNIYSIREGR